jgi:hypothetical protein
MLPSLKATPAFGIPPDCAFAAAFDDFALIDFCQKIASPVTILPFRSSLSKSLSASGPRTVCKPPASCFSPHGSRYWPSATRPNACLMSACSSADAFNLAMRRLACVQLVPWEPVSLGEIAIAAR